MQSIPVFLLGSQRLHPRFDHAKLSAQLSFTVGRRTRMALLYLVFSITLLGQREGTHKQ